MINPASIFKIKSAWEKFTTGHPKFPAFLSAAGNGMVTENSIIEINITSADGRSISTNVKLTSEDMELFEQIKNIR